MRRLTTAERRRILATPSPLLRETRLALLEAFERGDRLVAEEHGAQCRCDRCRPEAA